MKKMNFNFFEIIISYIIDFYDIYINAIKNIVKFNITFALVVKFLFILIGVLWFSKMWYTVIVALGVTLLLVLNSLKIIWGRHAEFKS